MDLEDINPTTVWGEKFQLLPDDIDPELIQWCHGLGSLNKTTQKYDLNEDSTDELKRIRLKVREDVSKKNFKILEDLGAANIVSNDLIPILKDHTHDDSIRGRQFFLTVLDVLVFLTHPVILHFDEKIPDDKEYLQRYLKLLGLTYRYKLDFSENKKVWHTLSKHMCTIIQKPPDETRSLLEHRILDSILVLIRNILFVPLDANHAARMTNQEANPHDRVIEMMKESTVMEMIILMISDEDESRYGMVLIEIIHHILREQNAEFLAKSYDPNRTEDEPAVRTQYERERDEKELKLLVNKERAMKQQRSYRRQQFRGATYQVKDLKSLGEKDAVIHYIPENLEVTTLHKSKQGVRKPKNRRDLKDSNFTVDTDSGYIHKSTPKIRRYLSKFCHEFLEHYNSLMMAVKRQLEHQKQDFHDETFYLWATHFFMEFNRHSKPDVSLISVTYSVESMHYFHTQIMEYSEQLRLEKKSWVPWSRRLHYAMKAYRELLFTLGFCDSSHDHKFLTETKQLKTKMFFDEDYRELLLFLLKDFKPTRNTRRYLIDLIQTNHIFLRLLKTYCIINDHLKVEKKPKGKSKLRKCKAVKKKKNTRVPNTEEAWDDVRVGIRPTLDGVVDLPTVEKDPDVNPMDGTVDDEPDLQKLAIIQRLHRLMTLKKTPSAVALFRNARNAWVDDPSLPFGSHEATPEQEEETLKAIFLMDMNSIADEAEEDEGAEDQDAKDGNQEEEDESDDGQVSKKKSRSKEKSLGFIDVFRKYCNPKVIAAYVHVLKEFSQNSPETNHCIVRFLHRVSFECGLHGMMFQASVFRVFQKILKYPPSEEVAELLGLAKFIIRKFVEIYPKNDLLLMELLFWKTSREATALESGYEDADFYKTTRSAKTKTDEKQYPSRDFIEDDDEDDRSKSPSIKDFVIEDDESDHEFKLDDEVIKAMPPDHEDDNSKSSSLSSAVSSVSTPEPAEEDNLAGGDKALEDNEDAANDHDDDDQLQENMNQEEEDALPGQKKRKRIIQIESEDED